MLTGDKLLARVKELCSENKNEQDQRITMAQTLSKAYGWDVNELMAMDYRDLSDTYSERYLDYIYGV